MNKTQDENLGTLLTAMETSQLVIHESTLHMTRELAYLGLCHEALQAGHATGAYTLPKHDEKELDAYAQAIKERYTDKPSTYGKLPLNTVN